MDATVKALGETRGAVDGNVPVVSVVVPCFNGGRFLDGLMASLDRQTLRAFETIIVNDGSTDDATLRKLASLEGRARIIHQNNRGLSAARNAGIAAARCEFVAVLDCDDTFEPPFLEEASALLRGAPKEVAVAVSHLRLVGAVQGLVERYFNPFDLLFTNTMHSGVMVRKTSWQAVGGYDETMLQGYEDWEFYLRLSLAGYRAVEIPKYYYNYALATGGMLLGRSSQVHAALWRSMRAKHAAHYTPLAIVRRWRTARGDNSHVSLAKAFIVLGLAKMLPDAWYSRLIMEHRRRKLLEGRLPTDAGPVSYDYPGVDGTVSHSR